MKPKGNVKSKTNSKMKGKTKASSHKASLSKLANKRNNRLAKQGKLNKADKKKKQRRARILELNEKQTNQKAEESLDSSENENDDGELFEEDISFFQHVQNAQEFAKINLGSEESSEPRKKKRKRGEEEEEGEEVYEQKQRKFASDEENSKMKMLLPIISKGQVIKRMVEHEEEPVKEDEDKFEEGGEANEDNTEKEESTPEDDEAKIIASLNGAQLFAYRKAKLEKKKSEIASLCHAVLEDPQNNMKKLKELRLLLGEMSIGISLTVRKYAMISLMEVFKDIVPGYRLRIPTDKEKSHKVKKETKELLDYEASFLLSYRIYLEFLETMAKVKPIEEKTFLTKHGITNLKIPGNSAVELGLSALKCLCEMLVNHPHFNYRNNIIISVVRFTNHGNEMYSSVACEALKTVFKQDKSGEVTLEIVRAISRMVKKILFNVKPQVLEPFLSLKIKEVDLSSINTKVEKMKREEKMKKYSRRERKRLKEKEKLDKELLETKATEDKSRILKTHTEVIQAVFETYIRVLKQAPDSVLLPPVLEGLAKFAHLINVEYFDSLFASLNKLIESNIMTSQEMLHCMQTAFTILSGQGSVLNIDPSEFYKHLYNSLLSVHAGSSNESSPIVLKCLDSMISKRRKQVSHQRILAFMKRLATLCLQQTPDTCVAYMAAIRQFLHSYRQTDILFDTEVKGSGLYRPFLEDPEHCCANNSSLWELHLLRHHYDTEVQVFSKHLLRVAPMAGEHQLSQGLSRKSPMEHYVQKHNSEIFDSKIPEKPLKKKKVYKSGFVNSEFEAYTQKVMESIQSQPLRDDGVLNNCNSSDNTIAKS